MIGQFFGEEILKRLLRTGNTSVQFQAGSRLRLGGLGAILDSASNLNTGTSGLGGIDVGSIAANNYYYVYTVISGTTVGLIASLSSLAPTGFLQYRKIGAFNTEKLSTNIEQVMSFGEQPDSELYLRGVVGVGSTNTRILRFLAIIESKGLELTWNQDSTLGDHVLTGVSGEHTVFGGVADVVGSGQEFGVTINGINNNVSFGSFLTATPEKVFTSNRTKITNNHVSAISGRKNLEANSLLRIHLNVSNLPSTLNENFFTTFKKGSTEIDWSI